RTSTSPRGAARSGRSSRASPLPSDPPPPLGSSGSGRDRLRISFPTNVMRVSPIPEGNEVSEAGPATMPSVDDAGAPEIEGQVCEHFQRAAEILGPRWKPQGI